MTKPARVHPLTKQQITAMKIALKEQEGLAVNEEDIIGALVYGNTLAQLANLLPVYKRYTGAAEREGAP